MRPSEDVEYILTECFITLGQHVGERVVSGEAARFWRDRYRERFGITLAQEHPRVWAQDRANVLAKAASLGRKAADLAAEDRTMGITEDHARRASEANDCRPRTRYGMFSIWCIPPWLRSAAVERSTRLDWRERWIRRVFAHGRDSSVNSPSWAVPDRRPPSLA